MKNEVLKKYPHVFQPLKVKNIIYSNRLCSTTMSTVPTHTHLSSTNYGGIGIYDKSLGGVAMLGMMYHGTAGTSQYEANGADPFSKYNMDILRESLSVVKQGGALAGMAIGMGNTINGITYSPSGLPFARPYSRPTEIIDENKINFLIEQAVEKAKKASRFGFDLLILDISNDNIIGHFMAPGFNLRNDRWGGSYENRFRLGKILVERVREAIGDFVLELRISATLGVKETYPLSEMLQFLKEVEDKIDIINIVTGMDEYHDGNVKLCPPIFEKHILNYHVAKEIKKTCPEKIINISGSIMNIQEVEKVLSDKIADLVLIGRAIVADPYMPKKVLEGKEDDIVPCIRCNNCYHIATEHFNTCCSVNPRIYRENRVPLELEKTKEPKKVVVVGGGPAGMKTALTLNQKGHDVVILEKKNKLGGQLIYATQGKFKEDLNHYLNYLRVQVAKNKIKVRLNTEANEDTILEEKPDTLILAIGAKPNIPQIEGIQRLNVFEATKFIERGFEKAKEKITILGGGSIGCEIALELALLGREVNIVESSDSLAASGNELYRTNLFMYLLNNEKIHILRKAKCIKIDEKESIIKLKDGSIKSIEHDEFIIAVGFKQDIDSLYALFGIIPDTRYVGDCKKVASLTEAVTEGYFLGASV
nr:FAD-dependent oxidoreductase [Traorella massiliensis]